MIDGLKTWNFEDFELPEYERSQNLIPSDESLRLDLSNVLASRINEAQIANENILAIEASDNALRNEYYKMRNLLK